MPVDWLDVLPAQADCLRDYQRHQLADLAVAMHEGVRRVLVQLATGGGKTHEIATIVAAAASAGLRVLLLATRTRLVRQIHERLVAFNVPHGVIAAPLPELRDYHRTVQVASVDTLYRRAVCDKRIPLPGADVVIFDEAHLSTAETRVRILDAYPEAVRVGFSATPCRKSGRGLGQAFDRIITGPSIRELIDAGYLVPMRVYNTPLVTEKELRALPKDTDNDYASGALGELLNRPKLVGDVISNWLRIANGKRTLVFAVNKAHGAALLEDFSRQGVAAELLTDEDDEATREQVIQRLESGATKVVLNVFLMAYGVDIPGVECVVLARPTRSLVMYLQSIGRGMRPAPGKSECLLIDHGRVVETLGLPHADRAWTLEVGRNINADAIASHKRQSIEEKLRTCTQCATLWSVAEQGHACPSCGWQSMPKAKAIVVQDAELQELIEDEAQVGVTDAKVARFYQEACGWYQRRWPDRWMAKPNSGRWWAWSNACRKFRLGEQKMPSSYWSLVVVPASVETSGWLKSQMIRYAKSRQRAA